MDRNQTHRNRRRALKALHFTGLFLTMMVICIPGLWIVLNSFRPTVEIMAKPPIWVPSFTLEHYRAMFAGAGEGGVPVFSYFRNSLIVSVTSTLIAILIGMSGGYAFARYRFKGKNSYFVGLMLFRAVPGVALSLPLFIVFAKVGIIDTHFGLILAKKNSRKLTFNFIYALELFNVGYINRLIL